MRISIKTILLGLTMTAAAGANAGSPAELAQKAWQNRDEPGQTEEAIRQWDLAVKTAPGRADLWINLAKALGRAVRHAANSGERRRWADQARTAAERAVANAPVNADAYTVYGEALGQWANAHKGVHGLKAVRKAVNALQNAVAIDATHASAHMLLAEFYRQSPKLFSIGDKAKALEEAKLAVLYGPRYAINHLVLAKAYLDLSKKEDGVAELRLVVNLPAPPDAVPETRADQETAQTMLKDLGIPPTLNAAPQPVQGTAQCGESGGYCAEPKP